MTRVFRFLSLVLVLVAGACAVVPPPDAEESPVPSPAPPPPSAQRESVAVAGLLQSARADTAAGRLSTAAASLERALRLEPRNPRLWHELARVRLKQGDYPQAEATALRSNTWAGGDAALRSANQRIINEARAARR